MRKRKGSNGLTVNAVAGSYVVVLGLKYHGRDAQWPAWLCHSAHGPY
jgi:hypothetical protein